MPDIPSYKAKLPLLQPNKLLV